MIDVLSRRRYPFGKVVRLAAALVPLAAWITITEVPARAEGAPEGAAARPEAIFKKGAAAIARGEYGAAIDAFEALADQGFEHPDASYDRGLSYVLRARNHADRPGDLGRAAAAFEETLRLRPGDHDADVALDLVRAEVTRRRSRHAKDAVDVRPTLDRMLVGLAGEETWGIAAFTASLLLAIGLILRRRRVAAEGPAASPPLAHGPAHIAGSLLVPTALVALTALVPLAFGARALRQETRAGVVVVPEVYLTDENGKALGGDPVPEAASVEVGERRGGVVHVRWGGTEGWAPAASIRSLSAP